MRSAKLVAGRRQRLHQLVNVLVVEDQLVERVEGLTSHEAWERSYDEIREFERMLVVEGMILVKIWMHISEEEQLRRFQARAAEL